MASFYTIPEGVTHQLIKHTYIQGSVLVPYDPEDQLTSQLRAHNIAVTTNRDESNLVNPIWWTSIRDMGYDWVIANTTGLGEYSEYILDYGIQVATEGIAVLDRLSFIEPVTKRRNFLLANKLTNMVVLSPRPRFSSVSNTRDSVTSCWFVFQQPDRWMDGTHVSYAVNWDAAQTLPPLNDITSK
jgi:hypothetical protein